MRMFGSVRKESPGCMLGLKSIAACALLLAAPMFPRTTIAPCQKPGYTVAYDDRSGRGGIPWELDRFIICTIKAAQRDVHDTNLDGKVNCIDYTLMFKTCWDRIYASTKDNCEIVRNKNGGFHHLFIGIKHKGRMILVEPWAYNPNHYLMEENWPASRYDPRCNIYGETEKWLKRFRR